MRKTNMKIPLTYMVTYIFVSFALLGFLPGLSLASSPQGEIKAITGLNPAVYLKFAQSPAQEAPPDVTVKIHGGSAVSQGISGNAWKLNQGDYFTLDLKEKLSPEEGTIMFWLRPHWDNASTPSHTLVSFAWSGPDRAYGAITRGWWEPAGAQRTYFILNNQDHAHVSKLIDYEKGWTHLACTWKAGNPGFLRLYVNGFRAAAGQYTSKIKRQLASSVFIGSDQGSPLAKSRWAEADLDELALFPRALSDEEIFQIFFEQRPPAKRSPKMADGKLLETRAIFDEGIGWTTEAGAQKTIERIKRAGFNVYIPCVWHGQGTRYPSPKSPPEPGFTLLTADPLKRLIDLAHKNGIEVHPWFCVSLRQRDFLPEFYGPGTPDKAFDLHRPRFRDFIVELILDVVRRYDVDGVNLDYIRTMGLCKCDFCQQEYRRTTGRDLLLDIASLQPGKPLPPALQKWQDEAVEDIVRRVKERGQAIRPGLIVSVCGYPQLSPSHEGREEIAWANAGLIDLIFNMDYNFIPDFERQQVLRHRLKDPDKLVMLLANYQWDRVLKKHLVTDPAYLVRLINNLQYRWPGGVGVYIYSLLSDAQIEALAQGPFRLPARPTWQVNSER